MIGGNLSVARRGLMFILSSPSGAGKTTLSNRLLKQDDELVLSISATTRSRRPGEAHGKDYYFVSDEEFLRMRDNDELLEWANVLAIITARRARWSRTCCERGKTFSSILIGKARNSSMRLLARMSLKSLSCRPRREELARRLKKRAQDPEDVVEKRMAKADAEISHWAEYEYVIINYDLDESEQLLRSYLFAERLKRRRQVGLPAVVKEMMGEG